MKIKALLIFLASAWASQGFAGDFVTLPTSGSACTIGGVQQQCLSNSNGGLVNGIGGDSNEDPLYIQTIQSRTQYLSGFSDRTPFADGGRGDVVATSLGYRAFSYDADSGSTSVIRNATLTLLDWRVTRQVPLLAGIPQADVYDFVYQDSSDGKLVFASRFLNREDNNQEFNYTYRYGFTGYSASVAWTSLVPGDLRLYQGARTSDNSYASSVPYSADAIRLKGDYSVSEGNPYSGLDLVKTNATAFVVQSNALGYYQAGQEGQAIVGNKIAGFVPTDIKTGVTAGSTTNAYGGTYGSNGSNSTIAGTLNIASGNAVFNGNVAVIAGGEIKAASGTTATFNGVFNQQVGAILDGGGTFAFNGGYAPGNSPGATTITGDVIFGSSNIATFEIAGLVQGSGYDHLTVNGNLAFGGAFNLAFLNGFTASAGQTFDLFDFTTKTGTFSSMNLAALGSGLAWDTSNLYANGTISVISITAVPEPESYALMMLGLGVIAMSRRHKKKI